MRRSLCVLILLTLALALSSCGRDPHNYTIPADVNAWKTDEGIAEAGKLLPDPEKQALAAWMVRRVMGQAFGGPAIPPGMTVQQAIEEQNLWVAQQEALKVEEAKRLAEQEALKAKAEAARAEKVRALNDAMTVALTKMYLLPSNFEARRFGDVFVFNVALQNNTGKRVVGTKGVFRFADQFGDLIMALNVKIDSNVPPGGVASWEGSKDFNQFMDADRKLANTEFAKLKVSWVPAIYLFEDGTSLNAEE